MDKLKNKLVLNPIMTFSILILITIILSGFLSLIGFESTYYKINPNTNEYETVLVTVESLFSLSGIKYIFTSTVSNFATFAPLSMLIIILIGIGIMEKSGFLKTIFTLWTKNINKNTITFVLVLIGILSSIIGDLSYIILIPLSALLFLHGRRNPIIGIVASYAALTAGSGLSIIFTAVDSTMLNSTVLSANIVSNFNVTTTLFLFIMVIAVALTAFIITYVTEKIIADKVIKYEYKEEKKEYKVTRKDYRGLVLASMGGLVYLLIIIYSIIPGLPLSGSLLDYSQELYIDKLFSYESFFSNGFVFIVTIFFIILGLLYGIGSKSIKNNNDFCDHLSHSLDGTGKTLILILFASVLINVFKATEIGTVILAYFANIITNAGFSNIPLIIMVFILGAIAHIFIPSGPTKWAILSVGAVQAFMNSGLSPEFAQIVMRFSESVTTGLTPLLAYFVIYLSYIEKYNQNTKPVSLFTTIKYQVPYSILVGIGLLLLAIVWYIAGIPLGLEGLTTV